HRVLTPLSLFFFFQAEDGIRDRTVTGVQTCALPIWRATGGRRPNRDTKPRRVTAPRLRRSRRRAPARPRCATPRARPAPRAARRSEERRVGKECRARWARDDWRKRGKDGWEEQV